MEEQVMEEQVMGGQVERINPAFMILEPKYSFEGRPSFLFCFERAGPGRAANVSLTLFRSVHYASGAIRACS